MAFFEQVGSSPLYLASGGDPGWLAFVRPRNAQPPYPQGGIELNRALTDRSLSGSLVFASRAPAVTDPVAVAAQINSVLWPRPAARDNGWLRDPAAIAAATGATMGKNAGRTTPVVLL